MTVCHDVLSYDDIVNVMKEYRNAAAAAAAAAAQQEAESIVSDVVFKQYGVDAD
jgi:ribosomal protein L12E/L44/L45/RPP1/RPP2